MSDWFRCILCEVYLGEPEVDHHMGSGKHIKKVIEDRSFIPRYVFRCSPPSFAEATAGGTENISPVEQLWREYYFHLEEETIIEQGSCPGGDNAEDTEDTDESDDAEDEIITAANGEEMTRQTLRNHAKQFLEKYQAKDSDSEEKTGITFEELREHTARRFHTQNEQIKPPQKPMEEKRLNISTPGIIPLVNATRTNLGYDMEDVDLSLLQYVLKESEYETREREEIEEIAALYNSIDNDQFQIQRNYISAMEKASRPRSNSDIWREVSHAHNEILRAQDELIAEETSWKWNSRGEYQPSESDSGNEPFDLSGTIASYDEKDAI